MPVSGLPANLLKLFPQLRPRSSGDLPFPVCTERLEHGWQRLNKMPHHLLLLARYRRVLEVQQAGLNIAHQIRDAKDRVILRIDRGEIARPA